MTIISGPYVGRVGTDVEFSKLFDRVLGSGVDGSTALRVSADSGGLRVFVAPGYGTVRGHFIEVTEAVELAIDAGGAQPRIDTVVAELSYTAVPELITLKVIKGTPAATPAAPALTQTTTGVYQMPLANVAVGVNAVTIVPANVTDRRREYRLVGSDIVGGVAWSEINGRPSTFPPSSHTHDAGAIVTGRLASARMPLIPAFTRIDANSGSSNIFLGSEIIDIGVGSSYPLRATSSNVRVTNLTAFGVSNFSNNISLNGSGIVNLAVPSSSGRAACITSTAFDSRGFGFSNFGEPFLITSSAYLGIESNNVHVVGVPSTTSDSGSASWRVGSLGGDKFSLLRFTSSKRYKTNIKPLTDEDELEKIRQLRPVTFTSKHAVDKGKTLTGLIAEEVAEVLPDAVTMDDEGRPDSISLDAFVPHLISAVKAQQSLIEQLEKRLADLEGN